MFLNDHFADASLNFLQRINVVFADHVNALVDAFEINATQAQKREPISAELGKYLT